MARPKGKLGKPSGLALIESLYFEKGQTSAEAMLQRQLGPPEDSRPCHVAEGEPSLRTDVSTADRIWYTNFSAPASWNVPYSVHLVNFANAEKTDYMFHSGEELLVPESGNITYHFFWTPGQRKPKKIFLPSPLKPGMVARINPQIPHHTWSTTQSASAWMIFRYATNSPAALLLDDEGPLSANKSPRRRITADKLRLPGRYALVAWGIAELVRDTRQKAGLTTKDLSERVHINPSSLSRLEEAEANVSIELLRRICHVLRIGILDRVASASWAYDVMQLSESTRRTTGTPLIGNAPPHEHSLHPHYFSLRQEDEIRVDVCEPGGTANFASWIVLEGRVLVDPPEAFRSGPVVLDRGSVMHFRRFGKARVKALKDSRILEIRYSQAACDCTPKTKNP